MVRGIVNDERNHCNPQLSAGQGWGLENSDWGAQRLVMGAGGAGSEGCIQNLLLLWQLPCHRVEVGILMTSVKFMFFPSAGVIFWEGG